MQDLIDKIYIAMGIDECILPTNIVSHFVSEWMLVFPDNDCLALYNSVVSCYEWLIKNSAALDSTEGVAKREKEAGIETEVFERKSGENTQLWIDSLARFEKSPATMFPSCRDQFSTVTSGRVIVGGVNEDKIRDINCDESIRTGGASETCGVRWGSRASQRRRGSGRRGSFRLPSNGC